MIFQKFEHQNSLLHQLISFGALAHSQNFISLHFTLAIKTKIVNNVLTISNVPSPEIITINKQSLIIIDM